MYICLPFTGFLHRRLPYFIIPIVTLAQILFRDADIYDKMHVAGSSLVILVIVLGSLSLAVYSIIRLIQSNLQQQDITPKKITSSNVQIFDVRRILRASVVAIVTTLVGFGLAEVLGIEKGDSYSLITVSISILLGGISGFSMNIDN